MLINGPLPPLLSVSVMAHPSRREHFGYLAEKLDIPLEKFAVDNGVGLWANCRNAWLLADEKALYHVVVQDDAIVCKDFRERAAEVINDAIRRAGTSEIAISFYYGRRGNWAKRQADALARGGVFQQSLNWGVAICLPVHLISEMLAAGDAMHFTPQDDARIGHFLRTRGIRIYYPVPSLIDHRSGPSLVGDPGSERHAYKFIDS